MTPRISKTAWLGPLLAVGMIYGQQEKASVPADEPSTQEAIKQFNDDKVAELSKQIAGKEDQPAEAVFKNIKILTGVPAGNLLKIMQMGHSRSLGTSCALAMFRANGRRTTRNPSKSPATCRRWLIQLFSIS